MAFSIREAMRALHRFWYGEGAIARVARGALAPASWLFGAGVRLRAWRYDRTRDGVRESSLPSLSIGNLSVGGTGKTPVAAWAAAVLRARGGHPAIVMRGYGDDEPLVHARLNPLVPVVRDANRLRGVDHARTLGADCVILDDGFQHRRAARVSDWVLVAAEHWRDDLRLLPVGPLREPIGALERADIIIVTRKSAARDKADQVARYLAARFPRVGVAVCHLSLGARLDARDGTESPIETLRGMRVVAVAAVGEPDAFFAQLRAVGADIEERSFADHHAFDARDAASLARDAARFDGLVCTLKDVVKLAPHWPRAGAPLWYVSQNAVIEHGHAVLDRALEAVLAARQSVTSTAGVAGPSSSPYGH